MTRTTCRSSSGRQKRDAVSLVEAERREPPERRTARTARPSSRLSLWSSTLASGTTLASCSLVDDSPHEGALSRAAPARGSAACVLDEVVTPAVDERQPALRRLGHGAHEGDVAVRVAAEAAVEELRDARVGVVDDRP